MDTLNREYFERPESARIARGEVVSNNPEAKGWQIYGPSGQVVVTGTNGGIISPSPTLILPGKTLVRFGNGPFASEVARGGWWLDWTNYRIVESFADKQGWSAARAARELCAVPEEWSSMTMVIQATTRSPLSAFVGKGNIATATSRFGIKTTIDPTARGLPQVEQLYIPGLSSPDLGKAAILVTGHGLMPYEASRL